MPSPLQSFKQSHPERWEVLWDIPEWEAESVIAWVKSIMYGGYSGGYMPGIIRVLETQHHLLIGELGISAQSWVSLETSLWQLLQEQRYQEFLTFIEGLILYIKSMDSGRTWDLYHKDSVERVLLPLELSLMRGSSKWQVVFEQDNEIGLIERVNPELVTMAKSISSDHLTKAWNEAFSVKPNPGRAIEEAQRAVELAASEAGLTKEESGVYGKLIKSIREDSQDFENVAKKAFDLTTKIATSNGHGRSDLGKQSSSFVWMGMDLVQSSNPDRHSSIATHDFKLEPEVGQQAVAIATLICFLFKSGFVRKKG